MTFLLVCRNLPGKANLKTTHLTCQGGAGEEGEESAAECAGGGAGLAIAGVLAVVTSQGAAQEPTILLRPPLPTE